MASPPMSGSLRALALELKNLQEEPVEGFRVNLVNDENLYEWQVAIFGPPDTLYEGGYFKAVMKFPQDYPYSPPTFRFTTKMWHPNIYEQVVLFFFRTILMSVISLLNEPNTYSPANVDASVMFRKWRESSGKDKEYENIIRKQTNATKEEAEKDGVKVPTTLADYCIKTKPKTSHSSMDMADFYDDDYDDGDMDDEDDDDFYEDDDDDSGNGGEGS
uniref:UBC core domain-containing protein n=1 Tax=Branchiostoma floridae TaxID=7739 RepID=C3YBH3_BRAFL|eukprot:XP_002606320.1 hypothetical protein BRAFLDRAFT_67562 [Branchiostoma floridae]